MVINNLLEKDKSNDVVSCFKRAFTGTSKTLRQTLRLIQDWIISLGIEMYEEEQKPR